MTQQEQATINIYPPEREEFDKEQYYLRKYKLIELKGGIGENESHTM
jgi:hypothetical protein